MPGPVRLNPNRLIHEEKMLVKLLRSRIESLDARDAYFVVKRALKIVLPKLFKVIPAEPEVDKSDMEALIHKTLVDNMSDGNPNLLRAGMDWLDSFAGRQYVSDLIVNITPYDIADTSVPNIILRASKARVEECRRALAERDRLDALALTDHRELVPL